MSIFKEKLVELNASETYIANDVILKGDLNIKGTIRIDGILDGNITNAKQITIGKNSNVKGNISCDKCLISGKIEGNIYAIESIEILEGSEVNGDLKAPDIMIEHGAIFNGKCIMEARHKKEEK